MRVVSGPIGREHVHFEAPPSRSLRAEMRAFLDWWSDPPPMDGLLRSGLAHLVFVTIHPFDDGNGRIARAIGDMALAQDEGSGIRVYSLSRRIAAERQEYYRVLEHAQRGSGDITEWMAWFLGCLARAIEASLVDVDAVLARSRFWSRHGVAPMNERQAKVVRKLLEAGPQGFVGGMNTRKYVSLTGASRATAQRDLAELLERGVLRPLPGGGRTTSYELDWDPAAKQA
jgi:Fic family protein